MKHSPFALLLVLTSPVLAQSNIDPIHKFTWQENCGWINWRDANAGAQGVRVNATFLQGFAWGENIGFVNFGDGTPGGGAAYTNASGADHGVNILAGGNLGGLAWGENVGWINFGTAPFVPAGQQARFDGAAGRFRGYAWGENIGWVNLDDAGHYVGVGCYPDCNQDGVLTVADFGCFQTKFVLGDLYADCNQSATLTVADFGCFQTRFVLGCP